MAKVMCQEREARFYCPPSSVLVDNAAMIAWTGIIMFNAGNKISTENADIRPYERTDDVMVNWL
jgi:N6-L-threonylcarbamoyladenine synthase